jgi:hypothetical protein
MQEPKSEAMPSPRGIGLDQVLGLGNTGLLITGLMLPVGGAIARTVALLPFGDPLRVAVTLPAAELAGIGAMPIFLTLLGVLFYRMVSRRMKDRPLVVYAALLVASIALWVTSSNETLPTSLAIIILTAFAVWLGERERELPTRPGRPLRGLSLALALVAMYGLSALTYGIGERLGPAMTVSPVAGASLIAGAYLRIGEDSDWLFLTPCATHWTVVQVRKADIDKISWTGPPSQATGSRFDPYWVCP